MNTIYLIGFMGAGKSAVSRYLAKEYGIRKIEMDEEIVRRAGKSISEIFAEDGEAAFRKMETEVLRSIIGKENTVISCGGGTAAQAENVSLMKGSGTIIFLKASPETILARTKNTHHRPLLEGHKNVEGIRTLLEKRLPAYQTAADITIETDGKTVPQICEEILETGDGSLSPFSE